MARTIPQLPPAQQETYPWNQWFDGQIWELETDTDFKGQPGNFRSTAHAAARRHGLTLTTRIRGNHVYLQAAGHQTDGLARICTTRKAA